jgi:hypothetical protein
LGTSTSDPASTMSASPVRRMESCRVARPTLALVAARRMTASSESRHRARPLASSGSRRAARGTERPERRLSFGDDARSLGLYGSIVARTSTPPVA